MDSRLTGQQRLLPVECRYVAVDLVCLALIDSFARGKTCRKPFILHGSESNSAGAVDAASKGVVRWRAFLQPVGLWRYPPSVLGEAMKYKSLRFFMGINELLGGSVIIIGGLCVLILSMFLGRNIGEEKV